MGLRASLIRGAAMVALTIAAACEASGRITGVGGVQPSDGSRYPGFDIGIYPGDATLAAWRFPTSPYYWVGYYLAAPCHRDVTWMGKYSRVTSQGWGTALLYVGQQDWSNIPNEAPAAFSRSAVLRPEYNSALAVTCSATLLTAAQGTAEGADAATKAASEGFPTGTAIFLDVEYVTTVTQPLRDYIAAWTAAVLADGRYRGAIYGAKANAQTLYDAVLGAYTAAGRHDAPPFWVASATGFSIDRLPTDVGLTFATVWQGRFDVSESWGGITNIIDVDVAASPSPSASAAATP